MAVSPSEAPNNRSLTARTVAAGFSIFGLTTALLTGCKTDLSGISFGSTASSAPASTTSPSRSIADKGLLTKEYPDCPKSELATKLPDYTADYDTRLDWYTNGSQANILGAVALESLDSLQRAVHRDYHFHQRQSYILQSGSGFYRINAPSITLESFVSEYVATGTDKTLQAGCVATRFAINATDIAGTYTVEALGVNDQQLTWTPAKEIIAMADGSPVTAPMMSDISLLSNRSQGVINKIATAGN